MAIVNLRDILMNEYYDGATAVLSDLILCNARWMSSNRMDMLCITVHARSTALRSVKIIIVSLIALRQPEVEVR